VPQTQQAALQEGFAVKEKPLRPDDRLIQWAEPEAPSHAITPAITPTESLHTEALGTVHADATSLEHTKEHTNASASRTTDVPQTTVTIDPLSPEGFVVPELRLPRVNPEKLLPTLMLKQTLRSGQSVSYPGHVVIMGDVNAGAEIVAKGDVIVWGVLKGMVHAGHEGDRECLIRAHRIDALQIRIADILARRTQKGYALQASQTSLGQDATTQGAFLTQVAEVQEQEIKIRISRI
jgi:septum site-determining protein MinC